MKIRHVFEPSDFEGAGQMVIRESYPIGDSNLGFGCSVAYKIGYIPGEARNKRCKISLADGYIKVYDTIEELCDALNNDTEGFRPMTREEIA
jgi:hypothetical protein